MVMVVVESVYRQGKEGRGRDEEDGWGDGERIRGRGRRGRWMGDSPATWLSLTEQVT